MKLYKCKKCPIEQERHNFRFIKFTQQFDGSCLTCRNKQQRDSKKKQGYSIHNITILNKSKKTGFHARHNDRTLHVSKTREGAQAVLDKHKLNKVLADIEMKKLNDLTL